MNWASASEFFAMGGYATYVWGAYGVAAICVLADAILATRRHRRALRSSPGAHDDEDAIETRIAESEVAA